MKQLQASEVPLSKVFSSDFDFKIPDYQRPYAWGVEEAGQLLEDLSDALGRDEDEPYFLGSVVLVKDPSGPAADIIDGQQRITTVTVLLAVLRDLAADGGIRASLAAKISEPGDPVMGLTPKPRLSLRERDRAFFRQFVQEPGQIDVLRAVKDDGLHTDSQRNIRDNAQTFHATLGFWEDSRRDQLATMLMTRTFLVTVTTPDLDSAHRIFSVMNSRGLNLSPTDIFKAQVIGAISPGASADYTEKWEDAEQAAGREDFVELFLHIRLIYSLERAKQNLLKEFPAQVLSKYLPANAKEFIDDVVVPYARAYAQLTQFSYTSTHGAEKVNGWLKRLAQLDTTDWQAPALWALHHHGDDPAWLDSFFRRLERLAASMFIRRVYSTPRVLRYVDLLRQLADSAGLDATAFELDAAEKQATVAALDGDVYHSTKNPSVHPPAPRRAHGERPRRDLRPQDHHRGARAAAEPDRRQPVGSPLHRGAAGSVDPPARKPCAPQPGQKLPGTELRLREEKGRSTSKAARALRHSPSPCGYSPMTPGPLSSSRSVKPSWSMTSWTSGSSPEAHDGSAPESDGVHHLHVSTPRLRASR